MIGEVPRSELRLRSYPRWNHRIARRRGLTMAKKAAPKASLPKNPRAGRAAAVTIRMYRQGLGDCFLLRFPAAKRGAKPVYVMIDCGVFQGTDNEAQRLTQVANDIKQTTGGRIDLLVVTHEH